MTFRRAETAQLGLAPARHPPGPGCFSCLVRDDTRRVSVVREETRPVNSCPIVQVRLGLDQSVRLFTGPIGNGRLNEQQDATTES